MPVIWRKMQYAATRSHAQCSNLSQFWSSDNFVCCHWKSDEAEMKELGSAFTSKKSSAQC
jgi:hypothetical protein